MLNSTRFQFSTCFPDTCGFLDRSLILKQWVAILFGMKEAIHVEVDHECTTKAGIPMDGLAIGLTVVLLIPAVLVVLASFYDYLDIHLLSQPSVGQSDAGVGDELAFYKIREKNLKKKLVLCFSARKSCIKLFYIPAEDPIFAFIYGLRSFSIFWVIYSHSLSYSKKLNINMNFLEVYKQFDQLYIEIFVAAPYSVETFMFLSGFCAVYFSLRRQQRQAEKCFNPLMQHLNRYVRLTPAMAAVIAFVVGPLMSIASGPMWNDITKAHFMPCKRSWWSNFLYVNNFVKPSDTCVDSYWYLAADMQLFFLVPFVVLILSRKPKFGMALLGLMFASSVICRGVLMLVKHFRSVTFFIFETVDTENVNTFTNFYNQAPWTKAAIYTQGMATAYYLHYTKKNITMKPHVMVLGWTTCLSLCGILIFGPYGYSGAVLMDPFLNVLYGTFGSPAWGVVIAWIMVACATGYGGIINTLLSQRIFVAIGRLSYCVYLVQEVIVLCYFGSLLSFPALSSTTMMSDAVILIVYSIGVAIILHMVFEAPANELWSVFQSRLNGSLSCAKNSL